MKTPITVRDFCRTNIGDMRKFNPTEKLEKAKFVVE